MFTTNGETPISGYSKWKAKLDAKVTELNGGKALAHWTLHDLRRTFSRAARGCGFRARSSRKRSTTPAPTSAALPPFTIYEYEIERAEAMEAWARYVMAVVDGKPPQNVVSLRPVA